jgi:hypothetical protein
MSAAGKSHAAAFDSVVDAIGDLVERLVDASVRLSQLEAMAEDGADIFARLDAFDARLTALEKRQRRPPPFPITVVENLGPGRERDNLSRDLATERHERTQADERLHDQQQGFNAGMGEFRQRVAAFNHRLDLEADQFSRMRNRLTAIETRIGGDGDPNGGP